MKRNDLIYLVLIFPLAFILLSAKGQQVNDSSFNSHVINPAYSNRHPPVLVDAGHYNAFVTLNRIQPFCNLIKADGYNVITVKRKFSPNLLSNYDIVVIFTAQGGSDESDSTEFSAFSDSEIEALVNWIVHSNSRPRTIAIAGFNENTSHCPGTKATFKDANFVVGQLQPF